MIERVLHHLESLVKLGLHLEMHHNHGKQSDDLELNVLGCLIKRGHEHLVMLLFNEVSQCIIAAYELKSCQSESILERHDLLLLEEIAANYFNHLPLLIVFDVLWSFLLALSDRGVLLLWHSGLVPISICWHGIIPWACKVGKLDVSLLIAN